MKPFNDTYVMYWLLEFVDESSIIVLCKASKKTNEICKQYIEMEDDERFKINVNNNTLKNSELLEKYCVHNEVIKTRKMMKMNLFWDWGLSGACKGGHIDIVNLMIKKGATNWEWGLYYACTSGHLDIVKLMIEKGATKCGGFFCGCNKTIKEHLKK